MKLFQKEKERKGEGIWRIILQRVYRDVKGCYDSIFMFYILDKTRIFYIRLQFQSCSKGNCTHGIRGIFWW